MLERRTRLRADPAKLRAWRQRTARRLPTRSARRQAAILAERAVREAVFTRDGRRCRLAGVSGAGPCYGPLTFQHRRKASQGGRYTEENGAALCAGHNDRIEADAELARLARKLGLVILAGDPLHPLPNVC